MGDSARRRATYEDLQNVPEHLVAEIIDGELHTSPRPASRHARASSSLGSALGPPFDFGDGGPGGWIILDEPELHLGADVLVPDLAGWRRTRMPELPDTPTFELPPDWACEILSPSTGALDRAHKMPIYARHGVAHLWLIDPSLKTLEVYRRSPAPAPEGGQDRWLAIRTFAGDAKVRAEPFDAVDLDLSRLWAR